MRLRVCLKYFKRVGTEKRGGGTKILKSGQTGLRGGCLKWGDWNPLMNNALSFHTVFQVFKVLKNLLDSYSYIFITDFNVFTQNPTLTASIMTRIC